MSADVLPDPDPDSDFGRRARARLRDDRIIWLTTMGADGTPQPNPVWFVWHDPDRVVVYCQPGALRLRHIAARPRVSLNLDGDDRGGDIVVLAGSALIDPSLPSADADPAYDAKYADPMANVSGSAAQFAASYSVGVRITVDRVRGH
jgi:PPOX class probable F420-dependent enzyme